MQGWIMARDEVQGSPGAGFRAALCAEKPLQIAGSINAYTARLAGATGFRALYLSGGGVAANSLALPDLGISTMEDVLTDVRRIPDRWSASADCRTGARSMAYIRPPA